VGLFESHDYFPVDEVRPAIWNRGEIPFWYRQNVILYLRRDRLPGNYAPPRMLDLVHPELLNKHVDWEQREKHISGRTALSILARSIGDRLKRITNRDAAQVKS
jgi:hypothetical protein